MFTHSVALILLFLAVSPFHAPFQTGTGEKQQIASVDPLPGTRLDSASRAVIAQRPAESHGAEIALSALIVIALPDFAPVTFGTRSPASTGDYRPLVAILRL